MRSFFCILISLFLTGINAQNYLDLVTFSYSNTNANQFINSSNKTNIEAFGLQLNFPVVLNPKSTLLTGLNASKTQLKLDPTNTENFNLYYINLKMGINHVYSEKWAASYIFYPGIASDLSYISKKDFQIGFLTLLNYTKRKNLHYKYGIYYNSELYGPLFVPLFGLYYTSPNTKWEFDFVMPILANINYSITQKLALGLNFEGLGSTYHLNTSFADSNHVYVAKTSNELFSFVRFQLDKSIYIKAKLGYSFFRTYKIYDQNDTINFAMASIYFGDDRTTLNTKFKDGVLFKLEFIYRLHFD